MDGDGDADYCNNGQWADCAPACSDCCVNGQICDNYDCIAGPCSGKTDGTLCTGGLCVDEVCCENAFNYPETRHCYNAMACTSDANDWACCSGETDCVYNNVCVANAAFVDSIVTPDGELWCGLTGSSVNSLWDCDDAAGSLNYWPSANYACENICGESWLPAGEAGVGEYDTQDGGNQCCGDDANEYLSNDGTKCCKTPDADVIDGICGGICNKLLSVSPTQAQTDACTARGGSIYCISGTCTCVCPFTCNDCMDYNTQASCPDNPAGDDCWWSPSSPQGSCPVNAQGGCCLKDGWIWEPAGDSEGSCVQVCAIEGDTCVVGSCCSGLHCSTVGANYVDLGSANYHCCLDGFYWDMNQMPAVCTQFNPCMPPCLIASGDPFNPTSSWWNEVLCIDNVQGCCWTTAFEVGGDYHYRVHTPY